MCPLPNLTKPQLSQFILSKPCGTYNAALALEDAAVLGSIFSRLSSRDHIINFLGAFQEIRQRRCKVMKVVEYCSIVFLSLPPGPERETREAGMRAGLNRHDLDWIDNEGIVREQWEEYAGNFGYDAFEEADTWWVEWGALLEHADRTVV